METNFDKYFEQCLLDANNGTNEATLEREDDPDYWDEDYDEDE
jgi:hypothetical protein